MPQIANDPLEYYAHPGLFTDPREQAEMFKGLPTTIPELCQVVQGNLLHIFWAERYGVKLSDGRKAELNIRSVAERLAHIRQTNPMPLTIPRPAEERMVGNCRDFSLLLCSILRYQGVPARARCGFATYFEPERYEDHWICQYWKADEGRWVTDGDPSLNGCPMV